MPIVFAQSVATPSSAPAWTPASLSNLVAWYSADYGVYSDSGVTPATNGQRIQQWNDKSGNNYHLISTAADHKPLYQTTGFNSLNTVLFDNPGTIAGLQTNTGVAMGTGSAASSFWVGQMLTDTSANAGMFTYTPPGGDPGDIGGMVFTRRVGSTNAVASYTQYTNVTANQNVSLATNYRIGMICEGLSSPWTPYLNGVAGTPGAMTASTNNNFVNAGYLGISQGFEISGPVSEWVVTKSAMSGTDQTNLDNYFKTHWGLS